MLTPTRVLGIFFAVMFAWGFNTGAATATNQSSAVARIPLEFRHGSALVSVLINNSQPLDFKLDTGFSVTTIHPDLVKSLGLELAGRLTIDGIAGREEAKWYSGATFKFGDAIYAPHRVAVILSEAQRRWRGRDGILGAGFFRRFVVELDPVAKLMTLHEPDQFDYRGKGEIVPLQFRGETPIVEAAIKFPNHEPVLARYEIDSGCDGSLCLGHDFVKTNRLDELTASHRNGSRSGVGGSVETREGLLPQFQLGTQNLTNVAANFFAEGSPAGDGMAGHIGMSVLREFKVIFDYSRRRMILEPLR